MPTWTFRHNMMLLSLLLTLVHVGATAAPSCKGPNKNDPECVTAEEPAAPAAAPGTVDSATVDWFNQKLVLRGTGLDTVAAFTLGGSVALTTDNVTPSSLEIPFDADVAGEVTDSGNYALIADGAVALSLYFKSQVIDPGADPNCPCELAWSGAVPGWSVPETECLEVVGGGDNDAADIAGTVLTDPNDPSVYPHFPIGAAFLPGDPVSSVCRLVQVNVDATTSDLVNLRINENQQADCAESLKLNVCATTVSAP